MEVTAYKLLLGDYTDVLWEEWSFLSIYWSGYRRNNKHYKKM